jgi:hypothetical protein
MKSGGRWFASCDSPPVSFQKTPVSLATQSKDRRSWHRLGTDSGRHGQWPPSSAVISAPFNPQGECARTLVPSRGAEHVDAEWRDGPTSHKSTGSEPGDPPIDSAQPGARCTVRPQRRDSRLQLVSFVEVGDRLDDVGERLSGAGDLQRPRAASMIWRALAFDDATLAVRFEPPRCSLFREVIAGTSSSIASTT